MSKDKNVRGKILKLSDIKNVNKMKVPIEIE